MKGLFTLGKRFLTEENAAEVTELGIVLALVVAASIALLTSIGTKVVAAYTKTDGALP
jgi:Flp pilus assembly pilin Flp